MRRGAGCSGTFRFKTQILIEGKEKTQKAKKQKQAGHRHNLAALSKLPVARYGLDGSGFC
jgi:hypothetical protein